MTMTLAMIQKAVYAAAVLALLGGGVKAPVSHDPVYKMGACNYGLQDSQDRPAVISGMI